MNLKKQIALLLAVLLVMMSILPSCASEGEPIPVLLPGGEFKISKLRIVHDGSTLLLRAAQETSAMVLEETGNSLKISKRRPIFGTPVFLLQNRTDLEAGAWEMVADGKTVTISANGYHGFYAAIARLRLELTQSGSLDFLSNPRRSGNHLSGATGIYKAAEYAYNRQGEHRVMFYNVLFGSEASSGDVKYSVPPKERDPLQALMISAYLPDVLGCQEFNKTKRGNEKDGTGGLVELLAELGYAETVDPRVKNAYTTEEKIPNSNASLTVAGAAVGEAHSGYVDARSKNKSGATEVNYNGTRLTFYNNTPLFYNTKTTKLIKSEYYWYRNQWDQLTGMEHQNSPMDCGSKSATWGLFESISAGERYLVISTHMCTRSDYIRGLQARELVSLIDELKETYQCPVFLGGDLNGNIGDANYDHFVSETVGYRSLQDHKLATVHTSGLRTAHGYPTFDEESDRMVPGENDERKVSNVGKEKNQNSIDQILVTGHESVTVGVFEVVVDDLTLSSSDHFPIFTDFTIQ